MLCKISALSVSNDDKEFSCHEAISEGKKNMTAKGYASLAEIWQEMEPKTDIVPLDVSQVHRCGEDKKQDDNSNSNVYAATETCARDHKDEKFPRFVKSSNLYNIILFYDVTVVRISVSYVYFVSALTASSLAR